MLGKPRENPSLLDEAIHEANLLNATKVFLGSPQPVACSSRTPCTLTVGKAPYQCADRVLISEK